MTARHLPPPIHLRHLTREDLPMLSTWLREPRVARWWADDPSPAAVQAQYGPSIDGDDPTEVLIGSIGAGESGLPDGPGDPRATLRPIGLVQRFRFSDEVDYRTEVARVVPVPRDALSIDYLIGVSELQRKGVGPALITAAVIDTWRRHRDAGEILVPVAVGNRASWRALEKAGFRRIAQGALEPDNPIDPPDHFIYRIERPPSVSAPPSIDM